MNSVPVQIQGVSVRIQKGILESHLTSRNEIYERQYGGRDNGKWKTTTSNYPVYVSNGNHIECGLGAILFLAKNNPLLNIEFHKFEPTRSKLKEILIPEGVSSAPKFRVNGKDRWYFYEALEACRRTYCGTVKLPTGSGKTVIELVLGYNQVREVGSGIIIVPTYTIKEQFIKSATQFGIPLRDYREWLYDLEYTEPNTILISTPTVVCNDITKQDELHVTKHNLIRWIIADECHHSGCDSWTSIFRGLPNLTRSHGFSALPVEENSQNAMNFSSISIDDALTISVCGPVIYEKNTSELKEFLNIPSLINLEYQWPARFKGLKLDDWRQIQNLVNTNDERNKLISNLLNYLSLKGNFTICHVTERIQGEKILENCDDSAALWFGGGEVRTKNGSISIEEIRNSTSIRTIIGTQHLNEGLDLDIPLNITVLVGMKKGRTTIQRTGRSVRPSDRLSYVINLMDKGISVLPRHAKGRAESLAAEFDSDTYDATSLDHLESIMKLIESKE
jgi:superfamily II DNA or RNA helicase